MSLDKRYESPSLERQNRTGFTHFTKAKEEFDIRYYLWSKAEFEKEISQSFPTLRQFRGGSAWLLQLYMEQLAESNRYRLAQALLKRFHPRAAKLLGDDFSEEDKTLLSQRGDFHATWETVQAEEQLREAASRKGKFAKRGMFRRAMKALIRERFGTFDTNPEESDVSFEVSDSGWRIETIFDFGRKETVLSYVQSIRSEKTFLHHGANWPFVMGATMSFNSYLGISSQTEWPNVLESEVETTCAAAVGLCDRLLCILPKLLVGMNPEEIFPDQLDIRGF